MKKGKFAATVCMIFICAWVFTEEVYGDTSRFEDPTKETVMELATCLTEKGWVMYGSFTCSACRAQRKAFGKVFNQIKEIECNPHAPNTQVQLCLERKIKKTPTWILDKNGKEIKRIEGYQLLEDLALKTDCGP